MHEEEHAQQPGCTISVEVKPVVEESRVAPVLEDAEQIGDLEEETEEATEDVGPTEVDAGSDIALVASVTCTPARDLTGLMIQIQDKDGTPVGEAEIVEFDEEINRTAELVVKAPITTGEHTWTALLPAYTEDDVEYEEVTTTFSFVVIAHKTSILVWDVPTAIVAGETFRFKVGVKCSAECGPAGWVFEVRDQEGELVATGGLQEEPWPGTAALYYAEIEARAPQAYGVHDWSAAAPAAELPVPHEVQTTRIGVRSVQKPEYVITVEAVDKATQAPIKGAKVVVHPYRVFTDEAGRAQVHVPKGVYTVFVSGHDHIPYRSENEVVADTTIRAELIIDRQPTVAEIWG